MAKLTAKQQRFVDEYLVDLNATQAAIRAGYSKKTANRIGPENLSKPVIQEAIEKRLAEKEKSLIAQQDEVLKTLTRVLRREESEHVVVTVKSHRSFYDENRNKQIIDQEVSDVVPMPTKICDVNKAAELLGKYHAMWIDRQQVDIEGAVQIIDDIEDDADEEG